MFKNLYAYFVGAITLLAVLAAFSRVATMPGSPKIIENGANALVRLFNGVFGQ